jgi:hypothetical protein
MNVLDAILGAPRRAVQKGLSHIPGLEGIDAGGSEWLTRQGMRDSLLKSALSFGIDTATDPLTYIGAGTMKGALGFVKNTLPRAAERATGEAVMSGMLRSAEQGTEAAGKLGKVIDAADLFGKQASRSAKLEAETKALLEEAGHARPMRSNLGPFDPTEIPDAGPRLVKSAPTTTRSGRMYAAMPKARKDLEMVEQDLMANYGHPDYLYHSTTMDNANAIRKVGMNSGETSLYGNGAYFGKGSYDPRYFGGEAWGHDIVMGPNPLKNPFVINTVEENKQFLDGISAIEKSLMDRGIPYQDAYNQRVLVHFTSERE